MAGMNDAPYFGQPQISEETLQVKGNIFQLLMLNKKTLIYLGNRMRCSLKFLLYCYTK